MRRQSSPGFFFCYVFEIRLPQPPFPDRFAIKLDDEAEALLRYASVDPLGLLQRPSGDRVLLGEVGYFRVVVPFVK